MLYITTEQNVSFPYPAPTTVPPLLERSNFSNQMKILCDSYLILIFNYERKHIKANMYIYSNKLYLTKYCITAQV
jgi:hypothetical protein